MARNVETDCPGCSGKLALDTERGEWSHKGLHDAGCIIKQHEPLSMKALSGHREGKWRVNPAVEGGIERLEAPTPPLSKTQLGDVIKVDFKNKKRI
jgi:hypothetical protein